MGIAWSVFTGNSEYDLDIPDPITGLSVRDKKEIQESWHVLRKDIKNAGTHFFIKLFIAHPTLQKLFPAFSDVPFSELPTNKKLIAHGTIVMYSISSMVDNLEDAECLKVLLMNVAQNHFTRGVTYEHFSKLGPVMLSLLEDELQKSLSTSTEAAWQKFLSVLVAIAKDIADSNQNQANSS